MVENLVEATEERKDEILELIEEKDKIITEKKHDEIIE